MEMYPFKNTGTILFLSWLLLTHASILRHLVWSFLYLFILSLSVSQSCVLLSDVQYQENINNTCWLILSVLLFCAKNCITEIQLNYFTLVAHIISGSISFKMTKGQQESQDIIMALPVTTQKSRSSTQQSLKHPPVRVTAESQELSCKTWTLIEFVIALQNVCIASLWSARQHQ